MDLKTKDRLAALFGITFLGGVFFVLWHAELRPPLNATFTKINDQLRPTPQSESERPRTETLLERIRRAEQEREQRMQRDDLPAVATPARRFQPLGDRPMTPTELRSSDYLR